MPAVAIHRTDRMKHVLRRQSSRAGSHRAARGATAHARPDAVQLPHDLGAAGAVNGAIHAFSAGQRRVGRVHNGIHGDSRDVAFLQHNLPSGAADPLHTYLLQSIYDKA